MLNIFLSNSSVYNTSISKAYYETDVGGKGPVWLDIVQCTSSETKLINCPSRGKGIHETCEHDDDIGVICKNNSKVEDLDQDGKLKKEIQLGQVHCNFGILPTKSCITERISIRPSQNLNS